MLEQILRNKITFSGEIELTLFELCNMKCVFCTQDHTAQIGMTRDSIISKIPIIENFVANNPLHSHNLNIMGGEILQDEYLDTLFPIYYDFFESIVELEQQYNKTFNVNFVTNLMFRQQDKVLRFLDDIRHILGITINLVTSYDFAGRFTTGQLETFKLNMELCKQHITNVAFVATKQSIQKAMKDDDDYFKYLYEQFPIYFDYFVPDKNTSHLLPSDSELLTFYKWLVDNYPNVEPVSDWIHNRENSMTCYSMNKITILPNNRVVTCRYKDYKDEEFNHVIDFTSNHNMIEAFIEENECLSCEFFNRCSFRCFVQWDWKDRVRDLDECLYKQMYRYILTNKTAQRETSERLSAAA